MHIFLLPSFSFEKAEECLVIFVFEASGNPQVHAAEKEKEKKD